MALRVINERTDSKIIEGVADSELIREIEESRNNSPAKAYVDMLVERLNSYNLQFWEIGGTVRSVLLKKKYGADIPPSDIDILVDDSNSRIDMFGVCRGLPGKIGNNYHDNVKWTINGYEIDIPTCSSERARREGISGLENFLLGSDFNLGTIAYDSAHREVLALNAFEGINNKTISLMNCDKKRLEAALVRAVIFEQKLGKLGFTLDEMTLRYIRLLYSPVLDDSIKGYMEYKHIPKDRHGGVINRLNEISGHGSKETKSYGMEVTSGAAAH